MEVGIYYPSRAPGCGFLVTTRINLPFLVRNPGTKPSFVTGILCGGRLKVHHQLRRKDPFRQGNKNTFFWWVLETNERSHIACSTVDHGHMSQTSGPTRLLKGVRILTSIYIYIQQKLLLKIFEGNI